MYNSVLLILVIINTLNGSDIVVNIDIVENKTYQ